MDILIIILLVILICSIGYAIFLLLKKPDNQNVSEKILLLERDKVRLTESKIRLESELDRKSEELWMLKWELKKTFQERDELRGKHETITSEKIELQSTRKHLEQELREHKDSLALHEAENTRKQREFEERIEKLASAEKALEDERQRIRREDTEKQENMLAEQTRIWNDHEQNVLARMREICQKSHIGLALHDNTNLPVTFSKLKPDALVPFLGQYVVFDAKKSRNIKTYIPEQVKSTAKKYKDIPEIYSTIFFVVPRNEVEELKTLSFFEEGFSFYIITPESIEPILASLRKISEYETIADFDPEDREAIVNLIANYDRHISLQNAANILFTRESIELMRSKDGLHPEVQKEITNKKEGMRTKRLNEWELKKIAQSIDEQEQQTNLFLSPAVIIGVDERKEVEKVLERE